MNFCLSDLVPPLRWSDAATIPLLREQPDLPDAWWRSLPMARVLAVLGPERLADILASIVLNHWPAAALGDVLPALHVLDPDEADEPSTAIALDRAGSWSGLLALTGHDLRDQPFIQPVPLLHVLFTAVFTRLAVPAHAIPPAHAAASSGAASSRAAGAAHGPVADGAATRGALAGEGAESGSVASGSVAGGLRAPDGPPVVADLRAQTVPEEAENVPTPEPEAPVQPMVLPKRKARREPPVTDARRPDEAPGSLFQPASTRKSPSASTFQRDDAFPWEGASAFVPEDRFAPAPGEAEPASGAGPAETGAGFLETGAEPAGAGPVENGAEPADVEAAETGDRPAETEAEPSEVEATETGAAETGDEPAETGDGPAETKAEPSEVEAVEAGAAGAGSTEAGAAETSEPDVEPAAETAETGAEDAHEDDSEDARALPDAPEPVAESGEADRRDEGDDEGRDDGDEARPVRKNLHALLDGVFANVEDKRWAVAQNRLFSDAPATVEALAKLFAVSPEVISEIEADLRRELAEWVASDEAAPYREHLEGVKEILGKAAPRERLINAAEWHTGELHSLDVPAWQFVLATLPGYHLVDEWLVEGDITELRHRTRDMISGAKPPLTINKALDMVSSLGIHPEVSKEWLENVPQLRILGAGERSPQRSNGAPALTVEKPGDGTGEPPGGGEPRKAPFRPLKDVSLTRRCFRQPDGRWWLRIDVTEEHLGGTECPLPSGFAAYLGMSPGEGRTVSSAVGELVLSWHDRPVLESLRTLLEDVGAKEGSHLFLTLSDEGVLRARHLPLAGEEVETTARALRLVGYTAAGGTPEQARRVIATRVGMTGPVGFPELLTRLRERGDRDLLSLLA
ncbi:hypothetical protein ACFY3V_24525 [Streptosporangium sp. NPDC000095]|uniref:hypothetical protein n=1 Tax=Streptosporangium sp. NPDC000095 TaxID=3366184 RepID=UPI0036B7BE14